MVDLSKCKDANERREAMHYEELILRATELQTSIQQMDRHIRCLRDRIVIESKLLNELNDEISLYSNKPYIVHNE